MTKKMIDEKYLKGLKFHYGKPKVVHEPKERDLEPRDVLDWQEKGDTIVLVTADGRKYTVPRKD
ncbi:MAG: hypothetical protein JXK94_02105 [Deltaproteobacteria bacterium]|nr:hypothetical protein [Deltaproteobacteria bacterium]